MKLAPDDLVLLMNGSKCRVVVVRDILTIEWSGGNYFRVKTEGDKKGMNVHGAISRCASRLPSIFFQANRNCIINLGHVKQAEWLSGQLFLTTKDDQEIACSRRRSRIFRQQRSLTQRIAGINFDELAYE